MALITSWGILWGVGLPFSNILTVVPFLVITIGVDDAFLILAAWRHSNPASDVETRIGETLTHSGTSVTVTSLTDVLCFMVGLFSNLPVVRLFCIYTSVAIMIDFIYQRIGLEESQIHVQSLNKEIIEIRSEINLVQSDYRRNGAI
ncbi:hypothetical protein WUBG_18064 [Wuchereria bancrofti]|uniref:SSD domain-containing protein n=1 Tax=Wuchereria bancrofti TaxID=6293 RepID=J9E296_WUCBA|nr:hypothetical protein WUBG_18064 [Wuchereria bancrofti]